MGSSFPCRDREELADLIAGNSEVPAAPECIAVAGSLTVAVALVVDALPVPQRLRRTGVFGVATVLFRRSAAGLAGRTDLPVPWNASERFACLDRRYDGPLCLALAAGTCCSLRG